MPPRSLFVSPDFDAPLDLEARLAAVPRSATLKGMFIQSVIDDARKVSGVAPGRGRYVAFKDYPVREWLPVIAECAALTHPKVSPREGLRRLGQKAYPTFLDSTVGRVVMAVAGRDFAAALRLVPRVYSISSPVRAEIRSIDVGEAGRAEIRLREAWVFPESWQVGVFEGSLVAFGKQGEVRVHTRSLSEIDIEVTWTLP